MSSIAPLWKMMDDATMQAQQDGRDGRLSYAAELRAVADWLVPDEPLPHGPGQRERHRLRVILLTEAYRAEVGDG